MAGDQGSGFGELLRTYRLAAGLSQAELAERGALSLRGVSDLERRKRWAPYPATVRRLAEALGLAEAERQLLSWRGSADCKAIDQSPPASAVTAAD